VATAKREKRMVDLESCCVKKTSVSAGRRQCSGKENQPIAVAKPGNANALRTMVKYCNLKDRGNFLEIMIKMRIFTNRWRRIRF
jgi:hypothetical protein